MTSRRYLEGYTDDQANIVLRQCSPVLQRGHLSEPRDIYPDIDIPSSIAYTRSPIPLPFLVLLYEKTSVFVPPLPESELVERWGTPINTITALSQAGIIVPIIGRPTDYRANHFSSLLELKPPSLWARGVALLERLGMNHALKEKDCPLPIAAMAQTKGLRRKYSKWQAGLEGDALTNRIKRELLLNYADLCIFGEQQLADSLLQFEEPQHIVDRLHLANEVRTYPVLFGLGGTANYDNRTLKAESYLAQTLPVRPLATRSEVLPSNLDLLFKGLGINVTNLAAREIVDFHVSGEGARLRSSMAYFERKAEKRAQASTHSDDVQQVLAAGAALEDIILEAAKELASPKFLRSASATHRTTNLLLKVGTPAIGGWLGHLAGVSVIEGMGGGAVVQQLITDPMKEKVMDAALIARFRPGLANLWKIAKTRRR